MENLGQVHISNSKNDLYYKEEVRKLVASGELLRAVEYLQTIFKDSDRYYEEALILSMEINALDQAIVQGRISWKKETKTRNVLARRLLKMVKYLDD